MGRIPCRICSHKPWRNIRRIWVEAKGFLLIDVLASLTLGLAVIGLVLHMMVLMQASQCQQSVNAELLYSAQVVQDVIQSRVRTALDIQVIEDGSRLVIDDPLDGITSYYSDNGNFYRYDKTSNPIAENVQAIRFTEREDCLLVELELQREEEVLQINYVCALRCKK